MGKRSNFERRPQDFYSTPLEGAKPLIPHLEAWCTYIEPCAGDGRLMNNLTSLGVKCVLAADIEPRGEGIHKADARTWPAVRHNPATHFITNPPWSRELLHPIIVALSDILPTWLLIDADWSHTKQAAPYAVRCRKIVAVGRLKWIDDSKYSGKDNCAWHLFTTPRNTPTEFYWRS